MVRLLDRQIHRLDDFKNGWACKALDGQRYPNKFILGWDSNGPCNTTEFRPRRLALCRWETDFWRLEDMEKTDDK